MLKVEFDGETVKKELETVTAQCQKSASIKGFRSGHAPLDMVAKLYEGTIRDRARQNLLEKGFRDAVKEKNLRAVGSPRVEEDSPIEADKPFTFNLVVEVAPTFDLPEYKGIEITLCHTAKDIVHGIKKLCITLSYRNAYVDIFSSFLKIRSSHILMLRPLPSMKGCAMFISTYFSMISSKFDCGISSTRRSASSR